MKIWKAIFIGQLIVNVPATIIIIGVTTAGWQISGNNNGLTWLSLLVGGLLGWCWWSFTIPRWRRWALKQGIAPEQLRRAAVATLLVWPKGWIFEKTEFKVKDEEQ